MTALRLPVHKVVSNRLSRYVNGRRTGRIAIVLGLLFLGVALAAVVLGVDRSSPPRLALFIGRFHPAVVHIPIGALVLAALLEGAALVTRRRELAAAVPFVLVIGALSALLAAVAGYFLSLEGSYDATLLTRHLWLGVAVLGLASVGCALAVAARRRESWRLQQVHRLVLGAATALVLVTSHYGGTLTRGPGYLTQHLPGFLAALGGSSDDTPDGLIADIDAALVFEDLVRPVFERRCVQCHGPSRSRGGLRLDGRERLEHGARDGPVLVAGRPGQSELLRRITLPPHDDEAMPPDGEPPLTIGETELIRWWIAEGASFGATVSDIPDAPTSVETYLGRLAAPQPPRNAGIYALEVADADEGAVAAVERAGFSVRRLAPDAPFLAVNALPIRADLRDKDLTILDPLRDHIASLDLSQSSVSRLDAVGGMRHLTTLHLQGTRIVDDELTHLSRLEHLESLNLYGTAVSDAGLQALVGLKSLRKLYVWETSVSEAGVATLKDHLPELEINVGSGFSETADEESP